MQGLFQVAVIAKFTTIEAMRNRLVLLLLVIIALSFALIEFVGDLAITEHRVTQLALLAAFLRLCGVVLVALYVVSSALRELQDKTLEMILAMAIHRSQYYFGKLLGYLLLAVLISLVFGSLLLLYAPFQSVLIWSASLFFELMIVAALSLVMLFSFKQAPVALAGVLMIYTAARVTTSLYLMAKNPVVPQTGAAQQFMRGFIEILSWLLPDLHRFTQTSWLTSAVHDWALLLPVIGQTLIYVGLLSGVALFDFYRKNF